MLPQAAKESREVVVGIDLGTTNSAVAVRSALQLNCQTGS
jgi:molecular chaperone DnaK (HSP70)